MGSRREPERLYYAKASKPSPQPMGWPKVLRAIPNTTDEQRQAAGRLLSARGLDVGAESLAAVLGLPWQEEP